MAENEKDKGEKDSGLAKAIKGLTVRANKALPDIDKSTGKPVMHGDEPRMTYVADLRPMITADVLRSVRVGNELVIVASDGSKHRVAV